MHVTEAFRIAGTRTSITSCFRGELQASDRFGLGVVMFGAIILGAYSMDLNEELGWKASFP